MKYYALTINPLNVTKGQEDIKEALNKWCKKANMTPLYGTYELAGKKLHYHTVVKGEKEPFLKRCKIPGYQVYFGGAHGWKWDRYIFKEKNIEDESIFQHYCQNNYLF